MFAARIIPSVCSCGNQIGSIQYKIEALTASGNNLSEACDKLNITKMCCRNQIMNCPLYFITSTDTDRFVDRINDKKLNGEKCPHIDNIPSFPVL
jgi:DNA-directed RNA polymerase subunit N (RpoN/RPB10)